MLFLLTADFKTRHTNISVDKAINYIQELGQEYENVIPNVDFAISLLDAALKNSLMTVDRII